MKTLISIALFILFQASVFSQSQARYQTYQSVMKISAMKQGENYQWENKNITVVLNYQNGDFKVRLRNSDFLEGTKSLTGNDEYGNPQTELEYTIQGIFPVREIINQKQINQHYVVELQVINYELALNNTINFDLDVTNPGTNQANYRIFILRGKIYNNEMKLPAFEGFNNEIDITIGFNGYFVN